MNASGNLEAVRRWYERTSGEYEASGLEGVDELLPEFRLGLVVRLTAFGSHGEAMRAAEEVQRA
jgi:hypothetical protein